MDFADKSSSGTERPSSPCSPRAAFWFIDQRTRGLIEQVDHELAVEYDEVVDTIAQSRDRDELLRRLKQDFTEHEGLEFQIAVMGEGPIFRSGRFRGGGPEIPTSRSARPGVRETAIPGLGRFRIREGSFESRGTTYQVQDAHPLKSHDAAMTQLLFALLATSLPATAAAIAIGFLVAKRSLEPIDRMTRAAAEITALRLDRRISVPQADDELARLARTLNGLLERLQKSFEDNRRFSSDAAHELRTPLAVIRGAIDVALESRREPQEYERVLRDLRDETIRLSKLADELLFLSRRDAAKDSGVRVKTRLDELVRDTATALEPAAESRGNALVAETDEPVVVTADPDQLRRVLINLLDNSIRHTSKGSIRVRVRRSLDNRAILIVEDDGEGIAAEHLPKVFDRFYCADRARGSDTAGSGLGLSISKAIVESHGGSIAIESRAGKGTIVTVQLPASEPDQVRPKAFISKDHAFSASADPRD